MRTDIKCGDFCEGVAPTPYRKDHHKAEDPGSPNTLMKRKYLVMWWAVAVVWALFSAACMTALKLDDWHFYAVALASVFGCVHCFKVIENRDFAERQAESQFLDRVKCLAQYWLGIDDIVSRNAAMSSIEESDIVLYSAVMRYIDDNQMSHLALNDAVNDADRDQK